jgi:hypothetical protein
VVKLLTVLQDGKVEYMFSGSKYIFSLPRSVGGWVGRSDMNVLENCRVVCRIE